MGVVQASESCKLIQNKLEVKMGNSQSEPPADSKDVLVHSFQLDADVDILSLPYCYPGKQEMFHIPKNFSSHLSTFLPYELGVKTIEEINQILKETGVGSKRFNFLLILCSILLFLFFTPIVMTVKHISAGALLICPVIVYAACFALFIYNTMARKKRLLEYIHTWNKTQNNGVRISLGGTTNVRGMTDGSETGGKYEHFYMGSEEFKGSWLSTHFCQLSGSSCLLTTKWTALHPSSSPTSTKCCTTDSISSTPNSTRIPNSARLCTSSSRSDASP